METIAINQDLTNYLEKLWYEKNRYADLLKTVNRDCCPMTDDEWNSSWQYYAEKNKLAQLSWQFAVDSLVEMFHNKLTGHKFFVDFVGNRICIDKAPPMDNKTLEQYADQLRRLYPPTEFKPMSINDSNVKDITMQVTDSCQLRCTYCYEHNKSNHFMTFETGKKFIDMILDSDERTNKYITSQKCQGAVLNFIGGEPWLAIDVVSELSDYFIGELFRRKHPWAITFMLNITSNGMAHFNPKVQTYLKRHMGHLGYCISVDGNKELHDSCRIDLTGNGTYDRAIAAIYDWEKMSGGKMPSKMTLAPGNISMVFSAVKEMLSNGYKRINLNCVYEEGWTAEHARELYHSLCELTDWLVEKDLITKVELSIFDHKIGHSIPESDTQTHCGGSGLMLAVDYKGDVFPCLRYMESSLGDKREPYVIGNLEDGIGNTEKTLNRIHCLSCVNRRTQQDDECFYCPIASGCGDCAAYNYEVNGTSMKKAKFICIMHKARVLANAYYQAKRGVPYDLVMPKEMALEIVSSNEYNKLKEMQKG